MNKTEILSIIVGLLLGILLQKHFVDLWKKYGIRFKRKYPLWQINPFDDEPPEPITAPVRHEKPAENPMIELPPGISEMDIKSLDYKRRKLVELESLSSSQAGGRDLMSEIDDASRAYGEAYWEIYKRAPDEWR